MPQAVYGMVSFDSGDTAENTWPGHTHTPNIGSLSIAIALEKRNPIVIIMAQTPNTHTLTG